MEHWGVQRDQDHLCPQVSAVWVPLASSPGLPWALILQGILAHPLGSGIALVLLDFKAQASSCLNPAAGAHSLETVLPGQPANLLPNTSRSIQYIAHFSQQLCKGGALITSLKDTCFQVPGVHFTYSVILGQCLNLSMPQFSHQWNESSIIVAPFEGQLKVLKIVPDEY